MTQVQQKIEVIVSEIKEVEQSFANGTLEKDVYIIEKEYLWKELKKACKEMVAEQQRKADEVVENIEKDLEKVVEDFRDELEDMFKTSLRNIRREIKENIPS